jgi:hypothetical protein
MHKARVAVTTRARRVPVRSVTVANGLKGRLTPDDEQMLDELQRAAFDYFLKQTHRRNGLVADTSRPGSPVSIAVASFALSVYPVAVEQAGIYVDDFLRTSNPRIFAAGDVCLERRFTNPAAASARIVVHNALFRGRQRMSALTVPWCTCTDPEIAHVGPYVKQARQQRIPVKTFTIPMHDVDRAITDSEEDGFVKIHLREGSDKILGATIVARHAGEMINSISLAMVAGIGLGTLATVLQAYPSRGAAIRQAAEAYVRSRLSPSASSDKS